MTLVKNDIQFIFWIHLQKIIFSIFKLKIYFNPNHTPDHTLNPKGAVTLPVNVPLLLNLTLPRTHIHRDSEKNNFGQFFRQITSTYESLKMAGVFILIRGFTKKKNPINSRQQRPFSSY